MDFLFVFDHILFPLLLKSTPRAPFSAFFGLSIFRVHFITTLPYGLFRRWPTASATPASWDLPRGRQPCPAAHLPPGQSLACSPSPRARSPTSAVLRVWKQGRHAFFPVSVCGVRGIWSPWLLHDWNCSQVSMLDHQPFSAHRHLAWPRRGWRGRRTPAGAGPASRCRGHVCRVSSRSDGTAAVLRACESLGKALPYLSSVQVGDSGGQGGRAQGSEDFVTGLCHTS